MNNKLFVITDSIEGKKTGIGYYSLGFVKALKQLYGNNIIFFNRSDTPFFNYFVSPLNYLFRFELVRLWFNILPYILKRRKDVSYIFNLSSHPHLFSFSQKEILVVHDIIHVDYPQYLNHRYLSFSRLFFEKTIRNAYKIITVSEYSKKRIIDRFHIPSKNIFTVFFPYIIAKTQIKEAKPKMLPREKYILNLNTIEPRKNIFTIVKAYEAFKKRGKYPHKLVLAGKLGWKYQPLLSYISKSLYRDDIVILGYVSEGEKKYLYTHADMSIFIPFVEGFGIPAYEAMTYGCPMMLSKTTSLPEVARTGAHYVDPNDIEEVIKGMIKIISNDVYKKKLIKQANKQIKRYTNHKNIEYKIKSLKNFLDI